ncbi:MAG: ATP/GTP-binding protein [Nitrososphaerota archaeon]|nr:ATP/GTP-binding protein [Candidatus Bathyarchaeota archaeon]MDW8022668.1 ATP/GTP-binding protein [Nitrososphaerota archaeon]
MNVIVLGTAGSGKSLLTAEFGRYLKAEGYTIKFTNLDPGCIAQPYECDFDIRSKFTLNSIMRTEGLGPNGALLRAMEKLGRVKIPIFQADFNLIDTPGQLEVFAFHPSGPKVVSKFNELVGLFLIDATIGLKDLPAAYMYSLAVRYRLGIDTITLVSKSDLLGSGEAERIRRFLMNPASQRRSLKRAGVLADIYVPLSEMLKKIIPAQRIPMVSAKTREGFRDLLDMLHEVKCACGDLT